MEENIIQGVFDFERGNSNGFENWQIELENKLVVIRREWSLPVGKRVRVKIKNIDYEFEGVLKLVEYPDRIDKKIPLHLSVERVDVFPADIERLSIIS